MSNRAHHRPPRRPSFAITLVGRCPDPLCDCHEHPWSYTVGRSRSGAAELVTAGIDDPELVAWLTNGVAHDIDVHDLLAELEPDGSFLRQGVRIRLDEIPPEWVQNDPSRIARWFDRIRRGRVVQPPQLLQIVLADEDGRFPDDPHHDDEFDQPLLAADPVTYPPMNRPLRDAG